MPTCLYRRYEFDADLQKFKIHQKNSRSLENMFTSSFQRKKVDCGVENFYTAETQNKVECFNADGFCGHSNSVWSNGLFLSIMSFSRGTASFYGKWRSTWKNVGNGSKAEIIDQREWLYCCRNVALFMVETLQDWCVSKGTPEKIIPIQASSASVLVLG